MNSRRSRMKPLCESRVTCETDDSEQVESRPSKAYLVESRHVVVSTLKNSKKKFSREDFREIDGKTTEVFLNTIKKGEAEYKLIKLMVLELEEENSHQWVPNPAFVHMQSMDYQTPKMSFSPNKPKKNWNCN